MSLESLYIYICQSSLFMFTSTLLFYVFSLVSILFSFIMIISNNSIYSILSLILVFFNVAGLFVVLGAEFLALLFIIVYVGAVAVLFLFVVMMLDIKFVSLSLSKYKYLPMFLIFGFIFFSEFFYISYFDLSFVDIKYLCVLDPEEQCLYNWELHVFFPLNLVAFSNLLYTRFAPLFIISSIILLISMIGAISLTLHRRNDIKRQHIYKQISREFDQSVTWVA